MEVSSATSMTVEPSETALTSGSVREPQGVGVSPYSLFCTVRYFFNLVTNGWFSYVNPDSSSMALLAKEGKITVEPVASGKIEAVRVLFLGDIMVSKTGEPPRISEDLRRVLKQADLIVANVEAPVVSGQGNKKRGLSLSFEMDSQFLKEIQKVNERALWVFSIANNHACDNSKTNDHEGVVQTVASIKQAIPNGVVIGADVEGAHSLLSIALPGGAKIGMIGWTELMNHDARHFKKPIVRKEDVTLERIEEIKRKHAVLIGFPHGNEEQSYYPLKEVRDRWRFLLGKERFDLIVGHGPHVAQVGELLNERVVFHSIGNFCSPVGKTQTKVGMIPEVTLIFGGHTLLSMNYHVHLIEQKEDGIGLVQNQGFYPDIIARLKRIWPSLFLL